MNRFRNRDNEFADEEEKEPATQPRRQFRHAPPVKQPSMFWHKVQVVAYVVVPLFVFVVIIVGGIFIALSLKPTRDDAEITVSTTPTRSKPSVNSTFSGLGSVQLLEAYLEANGGRDTLRSVNSMRIEGRSKKGQKNVDFQIIMKEPDMGALYLTESGSDSVRYLLNGDTAWEVVEETEGRSFKALNGPVKEMMAVVCRMFDPMRHLALTGRGVILFIREVSSDGRKMLLVTLERADGSTVDCYLDRQTLYLLSTEERLMVDDEDVLRKVEYGDFRMTSGVVEPFRIKVYFDDRLHRELLVDSIRINPGVMSSLFEVPDGLEN